MIFFFDFDGTIADTISIESVYYVKACQESGITLFNDIDDLKKACRINYYEYCSNQGISKEQIEKSVDLYGNYLKENNIEIPLFRGMPALINELASKHPVYVTSLNEEPMMKRELKKAGIKGIKGVYGRETNLIKAETLKELITKHPREESVLITDSIGDITEGKSAGVDKILAVTYGWGLRQDLTEAGADMLFDTVSELHDYLKTL